MLNEKQIQKIIDKYEVEGIDALLWAGIEKEAAEKEVTVDYYVAEFL